MRNEDFENDNYDYGKGTTLSDINVTPLVDVTMVLLIVFMITAPLMQHGIKIELPKAATKEIKTNETSLILVINNKKEIFINKNKLSLNNLSEKIKVIYENKSSKDIFIKADKDVSYGFVIDVMGHLKQAGLDKIGLITLPK